MNDGPYREEPPFASVDDVRALRLRIARQGISMLATLGFLLLCLLASLLYIRTRLDDVVRMQQEAVDSQVDLTTEECRLRYIHVRNHQDYAVNCAMRCEHYHDYGQILTPEMDRWLLEDCRSCLRMVQTAMPFEIAYPRVPVEMQR